MSETYDAPNQQLVRGDASAPWDEGEGGSPPNETGVGGVGDDATPKAGGYDPGAHTVAEVMAWTATASAEERAAALEAERAGKNRAGALSALESTVEET